ncbi:AsnC family protein [Agrobacterium sp. DSM 25558]|uniref:helix-turn-helix transcriptional regulator n=1 Tax=Agrobacterium sp. DSM 25558 TaxID=1907665 RepID=UPI0011786278|nr:AsnC family protein [Agrobacterium sp. DSM 25558]
MEGNYAWNDNLWSVVTKPFVSVRLDAPLKPNVSYSDLSRRLTDTWLGSSSGSISPHEVCRSVADYLRINMALVVVHTEKAPIDWHVKFIRRYGIPTGLIDVGVLQKAGRLCDVPVSALVKQRMIEGCQKAISDRQPITGKIDVVIEDARITGDAIILPDPMPKRAWCVILGEVHSISAVAHHVRMDDIDLSIVQLLREGLSARRIGELLELSPRTIEHRIEKIKARAAVETLFPLLIMRT